MKLFCVRKREKRNAVGDGRLLEALGMKRRVRRSQSLSVALGEKQTEKENFGMKCYILGNVKPLVFSINSLVKY